MEQTDLTQPLSSDCTQLISHSATCVEFLTKGGKSAYSSATLKRVPNKFICGFVQVKADKILIAYSFKHRKFYFDLSGSNEEPCHLKSVSAPTDTSLKLVLYSKGLRCQTVVECASPLEQFLWLTDLKEAATETTPFLEEFQSTS